jgi:hypothetical protein
MKIYCDRLPRWTNPGSKFGASVLAALTALVLAGCGGGGGGGGSSSSGGGSTAGNQTFSGTVTNTTTNPTTPASGYTVLFDNISSVSATTSSTGTFTLSVPSSDITGNDKIYVIDSQNTEQTTSSPLTGDGSGLSNIVISLGPPPAPNSSLAIKQ